MTDRPILFSGPMVRAILEGRKSQTRRVIRTDERGRCLRGRHAAYMRDGIGFVWRPYGGSGEVAMPADRVWVFVGYAPGDRLWVRETCRYDWSTNEWRYAADAVPIIGYLDTPTPDVWPTGVASSLFMPRAVSRVTLTVTDVRVERLQDISHSDVEAEGVAIPAHHKGDLHHPSRWKHDHFRPLWDSINGSKTGRDWNSNPWVVAVSFTHESRSIDPPSVRCGDVSEVAS